MPDVYKEDIGFVPYRFPQQENIFTYTLLFNNDDSYRNISPKVLTQFIPTKLKTLYIVYKLLAYLTTKIYIDTHEYKGQIRLHVYSFLSSHYKRIISNKNFSIFMEKNKKITPQTIFIYYNVRTETYHSFYINLFGQSPRTTNSDIRNFYCEYRQELDDYAVSIGIKPKSGLLITDQSGDNETINKTTIDNIVLDTYQKEKIQRVLNTFSNNKDFYIEHNLNHKLIILLHGEAGVGKTTIAKAIASQLERKLIVVNTTKDNEWLRLAKIKSDDIVVLVEDCDTIDVLQDRNKYKYEEGLIPTKLTNKHNTDQSTSLSDILQTLDGAISSIDQVVILTSSRVDSLDPDLIRPGRIDLILEIKPLTTELVKDYFRQHYNQELSIGKLSDKLQIKAATLRNMLVFAGDNPKLFENELRREIKRLSQN